MKILLVPQRSDEKIEYEFNGEQIKAILNGNQSEIFDFTGTPDGQAESIIAEVLPFSPVLEAKRIDGELYVKLLNYLGKDATYEEKFPEWREV